MILSLALRILRHPHVRGSAIAVSLALVPLIVILIVADGMIEGITSRYIELKTYHLRAYLPQTADPEAAAAAVRGVPGVTGAYVETDGEGLVRFGGVSGAVLLRGVDPLLGLDPGFGGYLEMVEGVFDLSEPGTALLGLKTAKTLGVGVGDVLSLATLSSSGRVSAPRLGKLRVTGVFSTGYQELDRSWVMISNRGAQEVLARERRDTYVGVKVSDPFGERRRLALEIRSALPAGSRLYDWNDLERNQFRSFEITRNLLAFVMGLIVLVGCVNVSSAVIMVVLERQRDIGILKSMGATPRSLRRVFLIVGLGVGLGGALGGTALGLLVGVHVNELFAFVEGVVNTLRAGLEWARGSAPGEAFRILGSGYYLERIPIRVNARELYIAAAATVVLSAVAAWLPARRAAAVAPLEAIRRQ